MRAGVGLSAVEKWHLNLLDISLSSNRIDDEMRYVLAFSMRASASRKVLKIIQFAY